MHRDTRITRAGPTASRAARASKSGTQSAEEPITKPTLSKRPKSGNLSGKLGGGLSVGLTLWQLCGNSVATRPKAHAYEEAPHRVSAGTGPNLHGGGEGNRTPDTGIFSPLLYQLSYPAVTCSLASLFNISKISRASTNFFKSDGENLKSAGR